MTHKSSLLKVIVGVAVLATFAVLFMRTVRSTRAEPFVVDRESLTGWTLVQQSRTDPMGAWLAVSPPPQFAASLGREVFERGGESVSYPSPAQVPLLLQSEFDRALAGTVAPEEIVQLARAAGFESMNWKPLCMGYRRVSEPGASRALYFMLFETEAINQFRQQVSELLRASAGDSTVFDPLALSPVLIVAGLDDGFSRWMPLRAEPETDCLASVQTM
jgi:hypothetical protein